MYKKKRAVLKLMLVMDLDKMNCWRSLYLAELI